MKRFLDKIAIPNLTMYLVVISGLTSGYCVMFGSTLGLDPGSAFSKGEWWNLVFFPFRLVGLARPGEGWFGLLLSVYLYWIFGSSLEEEMGRVRYNLYMLSGMVLITLGAILFPEDVSARYIYYSVFFAIAYIAPNQEVLLFFIIPIKMKWIALFVISLIVLQTISGVSSTGNLWLITGPLLGLGNFILFFGREYLQERFRDRQTVVRKATLMPSRMAIHRCVVCGMTELDDENMEFRYCVQCTDHEYCMNHLNTHQHINVAAN